MNYTEKITLEQALDLQNKIKSGEMPDIKVYSFNASGLNIVNLNGLNIGKIYLDHNYLLLTRSDYAQYIQGNKPLPDVSGGYGYANKPFGNGTYEGIGNWYQKALNGDWHFVSGEFSDRAEFNANFWEYCFQLTDLARVEAEAEPEKTEINAAQVQYIVKNDVKTKLFYQCGDELVEQVRAWINDIEAAKNGTVFSLLTTTYNSLPDEFKALGDPKPSMPSFGEYVGNILDQTDWKAKYELEVAEHKETKIKYENLVEQHNVLNDLLQGADDNLKEATASADAKDKRIKELEYYKSISDNYVKALEGKLNALEMLKAAEFNLAKASNDYYPY